MNISRRERSGRITWIEEEMLFVYCTERDQWEMECDKEVVVVDRLMLSTQVSLGAFQRAVRIAIDRAKGA